MDFLYHAGFSRGTDPESARETHTPEKTGYRYNQEPIHREGEPAKKVGQFLFECLKAEGAAEIFGVPGDYNFSLLDIPAHEPGVRFVNRRNELDAAPMPIKPGNFTPGRKRPARPRWRKR